MTVRPPDKTTVAFANIIPEYRAPESTIDLMRYRGAAPSGTMDFLVVSLFQWATAAGYETFNLGLSPLAGVGEAAGDPIVERTLHFIYDHLNQFYNFKGVHRFKDKFHPRWAPRYLIYPGPSALPAVALAIISADAGRRRLVDYLRQVVPRPRPTGSVPDPSGTN